MITFIRGNLFDSAAQVITNTVNCVGVMGKGVALEFKNKYPALFDDYKKRCDRGEVRPGGSLSLGKRPHPDSELPDQARLASAFAA